MSVSPKRAAPDSTARSPGSRPSMPIAVVDLPEPDSPMIVTVSPASMQKDTPSTARMTPSAVTSSICSSSTRSRLPMSGSLLSQGRPLQQTKVPAAPAVAQTITEQVPPHNEQRDPQTRQRHQPPRRGDV